MKTDLLATDAQKQLKFLASTLVLWSHQFGRSFRWRESDISQYRIVLTELMLQRTKADTVAKFEQLFFEKYQDWNSLFEATEKEISDSLVAIGLQNRRAATLKSLAQEMRKHTGKLPPNRKQLENLPGVGQYVANAIELLVFNIPRPLLDSNMARLLERFIRPRKLADIRFDPWLQRSSQFLIEQGDAATINWAVLDFAALVCKPRNPSCSQCPLSTECSYFSRMK